MTTNDAVNATILLQPQPDPAPGCFAVIAYGDIPAGRRAVHLLHQVIQSVGEEANLCLLPWRFDILEDPDWRAEAASDTRLADLLIISTSSKAALPAAVQEWVRICLSQKQGCAAVVVALLGPADDTDAPDSPRVQFLRDAAAAAGLGFCAPLPPAALPPPARPAPRILLVEDDSTIREFSAAVLARAGYQVDAVENGEAGWENLQTARYDLVITDNQMPGLSGFELVRKLRSAQMTLPVLMASGGIGVEALTGNQWLQPATLLPKPFTGEALVERVAGILPLRALDSPEATGPVAVKPDYNQPDHYERGGINE